MKVSELIAELEKIKKKEGDIEVTCTGTDYSDSNYHVFETTVENLIVSKEGWSETRVRMWL